jgi:hypothetical protein
VCVAPWKVLVVLQITSFFPSVNGLESLLFDGSCSALLQSQWEALGLCALWGAGLLPPAE